MFPPIYKAKKIRFKYIVKQKGNEKKEKFKLGNTARLENRLAELKLCEMCGDHSLKPRPPLRLICPYGSGTLLD